MNYLKSTYALPLCLLILSSACNNQPNQYYAAIQTAGLIEFRCIETQDGKISGSVLDGCGCNEIITQEDGSKIMRKWGSIACDCVDYVDQEDGSKSLKKIELVDADLSTCEAVFNDQNCIQSWKCLPKLNQSQNDWIPFDFKDNDLSPSSIDQLTQAQQKTIAEQGSSCPAPPLPVVPMSCESKKSTQNAKTVGYIGNQSDGQVALLELTGSSKGIVDLDKTIPGTSNMTVKGFMDQMQMHPYGEYLLVLKGTEGSLSIISQHQLLPDMVLNLGLGQIDDILVYPPIDKSYQNNEVLPQPKLYLSQAEKGKVIEIDLDTLSNYINQIKLGQNASLKSSDLISREWSLFGTNGKPARPYLLSITDEIKFQYHNNYVLDTDPQNLVHQQFLISTLENDNDMIAIDLLSDTPRFKYLRIDHINQCEDAYLVGVLPPSQASLTCEDQFDNDQDGLIDADDNDCLLYQQEAKQLYCPKLPYNQQEPSECADYFDNDQDGLVDRQDPGCSSEIDDSEELQQELPSCLDGQDNDQDGKIDLDDAKCNFSEQYQNNPQLQTLLKQQRWVILKENAVDECDDGQDNDQDGTIDINDIDCQIFDGRDFLKTKKNPITIYGQPTECNDLIDNDQDGAIDLSDRDCYFAQDHSESDVDVLLSPVQVSTFLYRNARQYQNYNNDYSMLNTYQENIISPMILSLGADGKLVATTLDLVNDTQQSRLLNFTLAVQAFAIRNQDQLSSILAVTEDFNLRNMPIQQHKPLLTPKLKLKIYAQIKLKSETSYQIQSFYFVKDHKAYAINSLNQWVGDYDIKKGLDRNIVVLPITANEALAQINDLNIDPNLAIAFESLPTSDIQVFSEELYFPHQEWNTVVNPVDQQNQLASAPTLLKEGFKLSYDPNRHPQFCRSTQGECVILGYNENQEIEDEDQRKQRTSTQLNVYEGIEIKENNPKRILPGNYLLSYEGVLPKSQSVYGSWSSSNENSWTMTDASVDFCEIGVEAGDLWEAQAFYPLNQESLKKEECLPFLNTAIDVGMYPLRYRVKAVSAHALTLEVDQISNYQNQMPPNEFNSIPILAQAPQIPPYDCIAQNINYKIRSGKDQWLLTHETAGYLHPWVNSGGQCIQSNQLLIQQRKGRVKLGESFENQWFKFQLNRLQKQDNNIQSIGIPESKDPYMIGLSFQWTVNVGLRYTQTPTNITHLKSMKWLANLDRLYLSDALFQNISELVKLSPYNEIPSYLQAFK